MSTPIVDGNDQLDKPTPTDKLIATWEMVSVISSFLVAEWLIRPFGARDNILASAPLVIALIVMILSHYARGENLRRIGWRIDNFWQALRALLPFTLSAAIFIAIVGWALGGFRSNKWHDWHWLLWLTMWALIQQYALQGFINRRAQIVWGLGYRSIFLVAFVFALLHLPNAWLAISTFIGGLVWAKTYQRWPNLFALSISHALISMMMVAALPTWVLRSLTVGIRYIV